MIYIKIALLICSLSLIFKNLYYVLTIYQQEHYDSKKLLKSIFTFYFKKKYNYVIYLLFIISIIDNMYLYVLGMIFGVVFLFLKDKYIIKLKITKRIVRFIITYLILNFLIILITPYKLHLETIFLINILNPFIIILINYINYPIEKLIRNHYKNKAKKIIEDSHHLIKIAITGSYGKTSTKNILSKVLEQKYLTLATPKSYNTMMGISKVINEELTNLTEIFICEMGAYRKGEIKEMTKLLNPNIGIITDIGYQHMETFKSIDNVLDAKTELIDNMNEEGVAIVNGDNEYLKKKEYKITTNYYGFLEENEICSKNIKIENGLMKFDIYEKDKFIIDIKTELLGKHNIKNILASYVVIKTLVSYGIEISSEEFKKAIQNIKPIKHRLSYEKVNNLHIYDDSYNSNLVGFKNSIEVIKTVPLKKVIITPGIVDCGKMTKEINEEIALEIEKTFDDIYIIDNYSGKYIYNKIQKENNLTLCSSFKDAYLRVLNKYKEEICLLIENDLPDNFLNRKKG